MFEKLAILTYLYPTRLQLLGHSLFLTSQTHTLVARVTRGSSSAGRCETHQRRNFCKTVRGEVEKTRTGVSRTRSKNIFVCFVSIFFSFWGQKTGRCRLPGAGRGWVGLLPVGRRVTSWQFRCLAIPPYLIIVCTCLCVCAQKCLVWVNSMCEWVCFCVVVCICKSGGYCLVCVREWVSEWVSGIMYVYVFAYVWVSVCVCVYVWVRVCVSLSVYPHQLTGAIHSCFRQLRFLETAGPASDFFKTTLNF